MDLSERYLRQVGIADPIKFLYPVTILGVGQIGSAAAVAISKLGCPHGLILIDGDFFEEHNISNQMCLGTRNKGQNKSQAVGELCEWMGSVGPVKKLACMLKGDRFKYEADALDQLGSMVLPREQIKGIVVSTPDNMTARKDLWKLCKFNPDTPFVIDARMAGQYLQILITKTMSGFGWYEKTLIDEKDAIQESCSARGIIYTGMIAGGLIAGLVKKIQLNEETPKEIRFDLSTYDFNITLVNGKSVSNTERLALASI